MKDYCNRCTPEQNRFAKNIVEAILEDRVDFVVKNWEAICDLGETRIFINIVREQSLLPRITIDVPSKHTGLELDNQWGDKLNRKLRPLALEEEKERHARESAEKDRKTKETYDGLLKDLRKAKKPAGKAEQ